MFTTIFAFVVMTTVVGSSLYMASEIHDYMENDNYVEGLTVFE